MERTKILIKIEISEYMARDREQVIFPNHNIS